MFELAKMMKFHSIFSDDPWKISNFSTERRHRTVMLS